ncbi:cysteine desulfurase family protein [Allofustis seminis]|uniref:cysteine desulfurase family protein n=1 Tax=Allofustis seminis TaxID=166939 RepID=UPI00036B4C3F|nr:cysteine desulfurase family protein [Allofustis seminis]
MIYFDNSATTKVTPEVLKVYEKVSQRFFGNPSSLHYLGTQAHELLESARAQVAQILHVKPTEIYFTSSGTEGDNWLIKGTAMEKMRFGKHIITTQIEHPAVAHSMDQLEHLGFEITRLSVDKTGQISIDELKQAIRPDTILATFIAVNNEMGAIQPLAKISEVLAEYPTIHLMIDAVQAIGKIDLPLGNDQRIDMAVFSGHKFHAPRGVGIVYLKEGKQVAPLLSGGGQEKGQRSSTENLPGIVATSRALRLLTKDEMKKRQHLAQLTQKLREGLKNLPYVQFFSTDKGAPHITCLGIQGIRGEVLVHALEAEEIYVSTTSACSSRAGRDSSTLLAMGIVHEEAETAIRISFSEYNTMEEVAQFLQAFKAIYRQLTRIYEK